METLSNTVIACYRCMTIRTKKDADKFLKDFHGQLYLETDTEDVLVERDKDATIVLTRWKKHRGDVFAPYWQVSNETDYVYKNRKWFNRKISK